MQPNGVLIGYALALIGSLPANGGRTRRTKCRIKKEANMPRDLVRTGSLVLALLGGNGVKRRQRGRATTAARR